MTRSREIVFIITISFFAILILGACNTNNFSEPQPVKGNNIYQFPGMFHGYWSDKDFDLVFTDSSHITFIDISQQKISLDSSSYITSGLDPDHQKTKYRQVNKVNYDSLGLPSDTSITYIIREPLIYKMGMDNLLQTGYYYKESKDSIIIYKNER